MTQQERVMTPARWQQIEALYLAAKEREPPVREAFLAEACGDDEELRAKVESMLAKDGLAGRVLDLPAADLLTEASANIAIREGAQLGPYRIGTLLGEGGMGKVYQGRDTRLDRPVAIKILNSRFEARFEREARAISALNHPHICTLYDVGTDFLVMELIEGETLASRIRKGTLAANLVVRYGGQIASALAAAHALGIVHRDLKPGNIMLGKNGVKVLDFGLATLSARPDTDARSDSLSESRAVLGTLSYMAPEQLDGKQCDPRSDIFSLGLVLYEMATGQRAFSGDSQAALMANLLRCEPPPLDGIPERLAHVIERCLNKDSEGRWQSAADVKLELEWSNAPSAPTGGTRDMVVTSLRRWLWPTVAGVGIAAAVALAFVHFRQAAPEARVVRSTVFQPEKARYSDGWLALSPDGRRIAFALTVENGRSQLWIRPLDAPTAHPLDGTDGAVHPFWSPDSRWLGFFVDGKLKKIDSQGGPPIALADAPVPSGGSWSRNGVILFSSNNDVLRQVSASGGKAIPAAVAAAIGGTQCCPWFLPDGEHYLFSAHTVTGAGSGVNLLVGSLSSTATKVVGDAGKAVYAQGRLVYLKESTLVAQPFDIKALRTIGEPEAVVEGVGHYRNTFQEGFFAASSTGMLAYLAAPRVYGRQLNWFDRTGKVLGTLGEPRAFFEIEFSPDRKHLAATLADAGDVDIWTYDLAQGVPTRLTFDAVPKGGAVWSRDGRSIVFNSRRKDHSDLYRKSADGTGVEELLYADTREKFQVSWSRDVKLLLYSAVDGSQGLNLWVQPLASDRPGVALKPQIFLKSSALGQFSPDGRWVAYESRESQRAEIYVVPFSRPAEKHQISRSGGLRPRWRQDGKEIFFLTPGGELTAAEVTIKGSTVEVGPIRELFGGIELGGGYFYDVSADGQRILVAVGANRTSPVPISLVQNWAASLKK
jgi:Tol biopolymer transport system component/tRNA A-37 threonylcarbamoyl transferase component Bud32